MTLRIGIGLVLLGLAVPGVPAAAGTARADADAGAESAKLDREATLGAFLSEHWRLPVPAQGAHARIHVVLLRGLPLNGGPLKFCDDWESAVVFVGHAGPGP